MDSIPTGFRPHIHHGVSNARCVTSENAVLLEEAKIERVDENISVIAWVERDLASDRWYAHTISVMPNSADDALNEVFRSRMVNASEA